MNPYLYCGGDPVNRVDPSGMSWTTASTAASLVGLAAGIVGTTAIAAGILGTPFTGGASLILAAGGVSLVSGVIAMECNYYANKAGEISDDTYRATQSLAGYGLLASAAGLAFAPYSLGAHVVNLCSHTMSLWSIEASYCDVQANEQERQTYGW
jgi:hypothetical protein